MRGVPNGFRIWLSPSITSETAVAALENPLDKGSSWVQQLIISSSVSPSSAAVLVGAGIVFQQFYDNLLHLVARKSFGKIALNFSNWNHKLRVSRLYTWRLGGHNVLDFSSVSTLSLLASLSFVLETVTGYSPRIPYRTGSPLVLLG